MKSGHYAALQKPPVESTESIPMEFKDYINQIFRRVWAFLPLLHLLMFGVDDPLNF